MSELINSRDNRATIRWKLLTGASALVLTAYVSSAGVAAADDADHPQVWIELGGQLERLDNSQETFSPPFFAVASPVVLAPMVDVQKPPRYSVGEEGKITFEPEGSDWLFSASLRYGRANASKHRHYQSNHPTVPWTNGGVLKYTTKQVEFSDGNWNSKESHFILDFNAGKDVGLGMFGKGSTSVLSAGVRFAQFSTSTDGKLLARPVYGSRQVGNPGKYTLHTRFFQSNTAVLQAKRDTHAVGPSLSWNASVPIAGNESSMTMALDWGVNAAVLFGRQRAHVHHQTTGKYFKGFATNNKYPTNYANRPPDQNRSRNVAIPNVGGFAGVSFRYSDAKVSFGYRGDFFFNAMDTGIDARKSTTRGFYGPFASISVGLGD